MVHKKEKTVLLLSCDCLATTTTWHSFFYWEHLSCNMSTTIRLKNCCKTSMVEIGKILSLQHVLRRHTNLVCEHVLRQPSQQDCNAMFTFLIFKFGTLIKLLFVLIWRAYCNFERGKSTSNHPEIKKFVTHGSQIFTKLGVSIHTIKTKKSWKFEPSTPSGSRNILNLVFHINRVMSRIRAIIRVTLLWIISLLD